MYSPENFVERDRTKLHAFMERNSFALLVSQVEGAPFATHVPLLLSRNEGPHGTILGHIAIANPQWKELQDAFVLAIFSGPHAYVSPTWYESENVVPTWNYTAVHAYGNAEVLRDEESIISILTRSVDMYEGFAPNPWPFDSTSEYSRRLVKQIVGFRIPIDRLEGKFKLSQNQPLDRQRKVAARLAEQDDSESRLVSQHMVESIAIQQSRSPHKE